MPEEILLLRSLELKSGESESDILLLCVMAGLAVLAGFPQEKS